MRYPLEDLIKFHHSRLSKSQKLIAMYVLKNPEKVLNFSAEQLGIQTDTSESTVMRFCTLLGFKGFISFKKAIMEHIKSSMTTSQRIEVTKQRIGRKDIIENVMQSDIDKIKYTCDHIDRDHFYASVESILGAKRLFIIGARATQPVAHLLSYNLSLIFDNVKLVDASSTAEVFEQLFTVDKNDVVIAFSFPRYSSKVVNAVKFAKSKHAKVIVVTDSYLSPLINHSSYVLLAQTDMVSYMDSVVAPISIINALIMEITHRRERQIIERFEQLELLWDEYEVYTHK